MEEEKNQEQEDKNPNTERKGIGYYFGFGEVLTYFFRKKDPSRPKNFNLKMMHGINKISILMFLFAVLVMIARRLF